MSTTNTSHNKTLQIDQTVPGDCVLLQLDIRGKYSNTKSHNMAYNTENDNNFFLGKAQPLCICFYFLQQYHDHFLLSYHLE